MFFVLWVILNEDIDNDGLLAMWYSPWRLRGFVGSDGISCCRSCLGLAGQDIHTDEAQCIDVLRFSSFSELRQQGVPEVYEMSGVGSITISVVV